MFVPHAMSYDELRREYTARGEGLRRSELAADPVDQFEAWFDEAREAGLYLPDAMALISGAEHELRPMYPDSGQPVVAWVNYWDPTVGNEDPVEEPELPAAVTATTRVREDRAASNAVQSRSPVSETNGTGTGTAPASDRPDRPAGGWRRWCPDNR